MVAPTLPRYLPVASSLVLWLCAACGGEDGSDEPVFVVDVNDTRQQISGFGVSSAWTAQDITEQLAEQLFSVDNGVGLSLLRVRIAPEGTTWETQTALKAQAHGARVWAAPWSPPGEWKSNLDPENGGRLLDEHYGDWADRLASFVVDIAAEGVQLSALSVQNEPDYEAEWETCRFTPAELTTFVGAHLVPALAQRGVSPTLIAPEASGWSSIAKYTEPLLADPLTRDALGVIGVHGYNGEPYKYGTPAAHGKELWLTEVSEKNSDMNDPGMGSALWTARLMYDDLTIASVNAWHYWWLNNGANNSGVVDRADRPPASTRTPSRGNRRTAVKSAPRRANHLLPPKRNRSSSRSLTTCG